MPVQRAAATADELALLRAVVADLSAETPVPVYCDWLDDHDDPRGGRSCGSSWPRSPPAGTAKLRRHAPARGWA